MVKFKEKLDEIKNVYNNVSLFILFVLLVYKEYQFHCFSKVFLYYFLYSIYFFLSKIIFFTLIFYFLSSARKNPIWLDCKSKKYFLFF